jgi:hypothetical protein
MRIDAGFWIIVVWGILEFVLALWLTGWFG